MSCVVGTELRGGRPATVWLALVVLAAGACGDQPAPAPEPVPEPEPAPRSAVLVTVDTLRADVLGAYGSPLGASRNIDRLAAEGVLFEQAHAASPSTLPSHATLLTGKRPFRHGVRSNVAHELPGSELTLAEHLAEAGFATAAEVASLVLARRTGIAQGFQRFRDPESPDVRLSDSEAPRSLVRQHPYRGAEDVTDRGIEFLEERADEPFFLWLHYYDPHWPRRPPEPFASRFAAASRTRAEKEAFRSRPLYAGEVAYVDAQLGRLRDALERLDLDRRTLLVVTSDHGEGLGDHGEEAHAYYVYQSTMHVPLVLWGPDVPAGVRVTRPVGPVDVAPTLLDWLGLPPLPDADGASLLPLVEPAAGKPERLVYGESLELARVFGAPPLRFVREGRWKYVHKPRPALYDLELDPGEQHDLAPRHPELVSGLGDRLERLLVRADAPDASAQIDPRTSAQLEALGYAVGGAAYEPGDELASLAAQGPDPDDLLDDLALVSRVWPEDGDLAARARRLAELSRRYPDSSFVLGRLLDAQLAAGLGREAVATLRRGVELDPGSERYWSNLGEVLLQIGRADEARGVLAEAVERFPCEQTSRIHLASLHARDGAHAERIALLGAGLDAGCEETPPELDNELAYALATAPSDELRDGARALELARRAVAAMPDDPLVLDTLAVAQAELGDAAAARETLDRALRLARARELPAAALRVLSEHAAAVGRGEPVRE